MSIHGDMKEVTPQNLSARGDYRLIPGECPPDELTNTEFAEGTLEQPQSWCACAEALLHNTIFQAFEALLIIGNAAVIGMETDMPEYKHWNDIKNGFLIVFLVELLLKIIVIGPLTYFDWNDADFVWNIFDFFIVALGCFDAISLLMNPDKEGSNFATLFRMIRLLRILRIFRIVKFLKQLYVLAFGLVEAAKAICWVTVLMFFVLYVCSIVLVKTIGSSEASDDNHEFLTYRFGTILDSMLTLFVLMSSPNFVIYQDEEGLLDAHPPFVVFLVMFITFGSFGMIALLTGVISESMFQKNEVRKEQNRIEQEDMKRIITSKCEEMFAGIELKHADNGGVEVKVEVLQTASTDMCSMLAACGIQFSVMDMTRIIEFMDADGTGMIGVDEFVRSMLKVADGMSPMAIQELQNRVGVVDRKVDKIQATLDQGMEALQRQIEDLAKAVRAR